MTATRKPSASDFTDPLLQVLGKLAGHEAEKAVSMKDTYQPIMDLMGIDSVDAHGFQDPATKKRPLVLRQIGWAYRNARVPSKDGTEPAYTIAGARGKWSLTLAGATRARELNGEPVEDHVAMALAMVEADDTLELDKAVQNISAFTSFGALLDSTQDTGYVPTLNAEPSDDRYKDIVLVRDALISRGISVHPPVLLAVVTEEIILVPETDGLGDGNQLPAVNGIVYHRDPYVVSLASEQTQCFGSFSPRSNVCGRCPLQGACLNVVRGKLAELGKGFMAKLNAPDDIGDDTDAILAAAYGEDEAEEPITPTRDPEWDTINETANLIKAASDGRCYRCNGVISKDSKAWWHRTAGLFHEHCY